MRLAQQKFIYDLPPRSKGYSWSTAYSFPVLMTHTCSMWQMITGLHFICICLSFCFLSTPHAL